MNTKELYLKSYEIKKEIISMLNKAGSGHAGGALGLSEIFSTLYFEILKNNPKKPQDKSRDFLILSNGHTCPVLYATLAIKGYFPKKELQTLRQINSRLQGHPHLGSLPGIENTSGPLGQGISQAVGLAASIKRDKKKNRVYCVVGDGEIQEGQCWEAFLFAQSEKLDNLTIIIDKNNIQIDGRPKEVINLDKIEKKLRAFNIRTIDINGNDINQIKHALKETKKLKNMPTAVIANTIPGKGVSFIENQVKWHGKAPDNKETKQALKELNSKIEEIKSHKPKIINRGNLDYFLDQNNKKIKYNNLARKIKVEGFIRIHKKDFNEIKNKKELNHFNIQISNHKKNKTYAFIEILKSGNIKNDIETPPILNTKKIILGKCIQTKEEIEYKNISKKEFEKSFKSIKNITQLKKEIVWRYSKSLPQYSREELLKLGVSITKLEILNEVNLK